MPRNALPVMSLSMFFSTIMTLHSAIFSCSTPSPSFSLYMSLGGSGDELILFTRSWTDSFMSI